MTFSPKNKHNSSQVYLISHYLIFLVRNPQKSLGLWRKLYRFLLSFTTFTFFLKPIGISTKKSASYSKSEWINAVVISPWFDFKSRKTSKIININKLWSTGRLVHMFGIRIHYNGWSPWSHKRKFNLLINPSGNCFNLKYHVELMTFISSVLSTTYQYSIPYNVSISLQESFQYSSGKRTINGLPPIWIIFLDSIRYSLKKEWVNPVNHYILCRATITKVIIRKDDECIQRNI